jgi:hypothetical protein
MAGNRIDMKNVMMFLKSATALETAANPASLVWMAVQFGEGNLTWTINDAPPEYMPDRGLLDDVRSGDQVPLDLSFEGKYSRIIRPSGDPEPYSIAEMVKGYEFQDNDDHGTMQLAGIREPWLVFDANSTQIACPPYACEVEVHNNPKLQCGLDSGILGEAQLFRYFRADSVAVDTRAGQISVTGKAHILIPMIRRAVNFAYATSADAEPLLDWHKDPRSPFTE